MCGILGQVAFNSQALVPLEKFKALNALQTHRGPNGSGVYLNDEVALGSCRLAIVDLPHGAQPMNSADRRYTMVYNGEIYNAPELRQKLLQKGYPLKTHSDTEVLLYWFVDQGASGLKDLNGMFAFAIWDNQTKELFIARDRMGVKPLYYALDHQRFFFSSELTPILKSGLFHLTLDNQSISNYLSYWYICEPHTIFNEIKQLPPGHYAQIKDASLKTTCWWQIPNRTEQNIPLAQAQEELEALLKDAVKIRLMADVPVGLFLSGGIDSGLIGSFAQLERSQSLKAFSIGFKEKTYSELSEAKLTADALGLDFRPIELNTLSGADVDPIIKSFDEPLGNASFIPTYFLSKHASKDVKVVLSGDGGDELFGGYPTYQASYYMNAWKKLPEFLKQTIRTRANRIKVSHDRISFDYRLKQLMKGIDLPMGRSHFTWREVTDQSLQSNLFQPAVWLQLNAYDSYSVMDGYFKKVPNLSFENQCMYADLNTYLLNDHLRKVDRMSMAHGLEVRLPFMDYRIVEYAMQLPASLKVNLRQTKIILKKMAQSRLPKAIVQGAKKGLTSPIAHWISKDLRDYAQEALKGGLVGEIFNATAIDVLWNEHITMKADHSRIIWALIVLNVWYKSTSTKAKLSYAENTR